MLPGIVFLCIAYLIIITWCKAGLAYGLPQITLFSLSLLILLKLIINKFWLFNKGRLLLFTFTVILSLFTISYFNPTYKWLNNKDFEQEKVFHKIQSAENIYSANVVSKRMKLLSSVNHPIDYKLAILMDLKNSFENNIFSDDDGVLISLLNRLEYLIQNENLGFLPKITIKSSNLLPDFYFFIFSLLLGYIVHNSITNPSQIRIICYVIAINGAVLATIGILQKTDLLIFRSGYEILGIWSAPEPRYCFSSFTYKNHWSAYSLTSLSSIFYLIYTSAQRSVFSNINPKELNFLFILLIPLLVSIPISGSRSGLLLLILLLIAVILIAISLYPYISNTKRYIYISITSIGIIFSSFMFLLNNNNISKEMLNVTSIQIKAISEGKLPYRLLLWQDAWNTYQASHLFGHGYNSYSAINPKYQSVESKRERLKGIEAAHKPYIPLTAHAHNDYLEWMCEWGFSVIVIFVIPLLIYHFAVIFGRYPTEAKILCLGSLIFFVYCVVDFPTRTPACLSLVSINSGLVFANIKSYS